MPNYASATAVRDLEKRFEKIERKMMKASPVEKTRTSNVPHRKISAISN